MKTLILTGWGLMDYAYSAAVLLRKFHNAELHGISQRRLPHFLAELEERAAKETFQLIILGIGLDSDCKMLLDSVKKLHSKKTEITFFSVIELSDPEMKAQLGKCMELKINADWEYDSLAEFVAASYAVDCPDLIAGAGENVKKNSDAEKWHTLIHAAMYRYRVYQDSEAYPQAIKALSQGTLIMTKSQEEMISHYALYGKRELIGESQAIAELWDLINKIGPQDNTRVLIYGASGTGKETVANLLHFKSGRRNEPFIAFNCACLSPQLLESRLFGHVKGAFTGAVDSHTGVFEEANFGTLFLDEVAELSPDVQAGLLRVLQEGCFRLLGGHKDIKVDVRIISATNKNLFKMVKEGKFREDLFYRLNAVQIYIPPLKERPEDIAKIADSIWLRLKRKKLKKDQIDVLKTYDWPGNVRELNNILERAFSLEAEDFSALLNEHGNFWDQDEAGNSDIPENRDELLRWRAASLLKKYDENISRTAKAMGISRNTMKEYIN